MPHTGEVQVLTSAHHGQLRTGEDTPVTTSSVARIAQRSVSSSTAWMSQRGMRVQIRRQSHLSTDGVNGKGSVGAALGETEAKDREYCIVRLQGRFL
jgi:hypothetical protein